MSRKKSSLQSNETAVDRELTQSSYDNIKIVVDNLEAILTLSRELAQNTSNGTTNAIIFGRLEAIAAEVDILNIVLSDINPAELALLVESLDILRAQIEQVIIQNSDLQAQVTEVSNDLITNTDSLTGALAQEAIDRAASIVAALDQAFAVDDAQQIIISAIEQTATDAETLANANQLQIATVATDLGTAQGELTSLASSLSQLSTDVATVDGRVDSSVTRLDTTESRLNDVTGGAGSATTIEQLAAQVDGITTGSGFATITDLNAVDVRVGVNETDISAQATQVSNLETSVGTNDGEGLRASVIQQATAITAVEGDIATQRAGFAIVANAGDSTAAIEVTADGGAGSQVLLKADRVVADRGNGPESLFNADGILTDNFTRQGFKAFSESSGGVYSLVGGSGVGLNITEAIADLNINLTQTGLYSFQYKIILKKLAGDDMDLGLSINPGSSNTVLISEVTLRDNGNTQQGLNYIPGSAGSTIPLVGGAENLGFYHIMTIDAFIEVTSSGTVVLSIRTLNDVRNNFFVDAEKYIKVVRVD